MLPNVSCGVFADFAAPAALPTQHTRAKFIGNESLVRRGDVHMDSA